jgi:hypothetical protein
MAARSGAAVARAGFVSRTRAQRSGAVTARSSVTGARSGRGGTSGGSKSFNSARVRLGAQRAQRARAAAASQPALALAG